MKVNDLVWGQFEVENKFLPIINSNEFERLKRKRQNGIHNPQEHVHTRYEHSLGVFYLSLKLIDTVKSKFKDYIDISAMEEDSIKIMALIHDIGHGPFSHLAERCLTGSHEENTIRLLEGDTEINKAIVDNFGTEVLNNVVELVKLKSYIKKDELVIDKLDVFFIISKLLSGGIDVDRLDYIARDSYHILGIKADFKEILNHINIDYINDYLEITFDYEAEYLIANYLNKRFEQYDLIYLSEPKLIIESIFKKYISLINYPITWNSEEDDILSTMGETNSKLEQRLVDVITTNNLDDILVKSFEKEKEYKDFISRLMSDFNFLENSDGFFTIEDKISIHTPKNKIYINKNGTIYEISESKILNANLKYKKYIVAVDLEILNLEGHKYESIIKYFKKNVEQEKKFIFSLDNDLEFENYSKKICRDLDISFDKSKTNNDTYYKDEASYLETNRITLRNRVTEKKNIWNVKLPLNDNSSITKRVEEEFKGMDDAVGYLNSLDINVENLKEDLKLVTNRNTAILYFKNSSYELAFDKTKVYKDNEEIKTFYMLECELINGNSIDLYFLNELLTRYSFLEECSNSKLELAKL